MQNFNLGEYMRGVILWKSDTVYMALCAVDGTIAVVFVDMEAAYWSTEFKLTDPDWQDKLATKLAEFGIELDTSGL